MQTRTYYTGLHVVEEFFDVFLEDLLEFSPDIEIEFCIDLVSSTQPIYVTPRLPLPMQIQ